MKFKYFFFFPQSNKKLNNIDFSIILNYFYSLKFRNYAFKQGKSSSTESIGRAFQRMSTSHPFVKIEFGVASFTIDWTCHMVNVILEIVLLLKRKSNYCIVYIDAILWKKPIMKYSLRKI